ncbi:MAG: PilZ domain-containing protein [Pseudomonadota bacterium]
MSGLLVLIALASSGGFDPARGGAVTPCDHIHMVERLAVHSHGARNAYGARAFRLDMIEIEALSQSLTAEGLVPRSNGRTFRTHRDRMETYISLHKAAALRFQAGDQKAATDLLRKANSYGAWRTRRALSDFWGCRRETGAVAYRGGEVPTREVITPPPPPKEKVKSAVAITAERFRDWAGDQAEALTSKVSETAASSKLSPPMRNFILGVLGVFILGLSLILRLLAIGERDRRRPCFVPARLRASGTMREVSIIDIGRGGAKIQGGPALKRGEQMDLQINGVWYKGKAAWANGAYAGISFAKPLTASAKTRILRTDQSVAVNNKNKAKAVLQSLH